jgi:hypothetical protein
VVKDEWGRGGRRGKFFFKTFPSLTDRKKKKKNPFGREEGRRRKKKRKW